MAGRRTPVLDVREMVRRLKLGQGVRRIARELGTNRRTVAKYKSFALKVGWLLREELPTAQEIEQAVAGAAPTPPRSQVAGRSKTAKSATRPRPDASLRRKRSYFA